MKKLVLLVILQFAINSSAQAPQITWQKCFGSATADVVNSFQPTSDGGYIMAERIGGYGYYDYYIIKTDIDGIVIWEKSFGGDGDDQAYSVGQTADGGYIVAGSGRSTPVVNGTFAGIWILKLDNLGNQQWQSYMDVGAIPKSIQQTTDGGYILAGNRTFSGRGSDFYIVKLDNLGSVVWRKNYGGAAEDYANCIKQTPDGGYIVAGQVYSGDGDVTNPHGNPDCWVLKLDSLGNLEWQKTYGGAGTESFNSIELTTDGGYIAAGFSNLNSGDVSGVYGNPDFWIVKLNSIGTIQWQKAYGGDNFDKAISVKLTVDGGYLVTGSTNSANSGYISGHHGSGLDVWVVKINSLGLFQWQKTLGGTSDDSGCNAIQNPDGSYIIAGSTYSNDGDVLGNHGSVDVWLVKLNSNLNTNAFSNKEFKVFPNPVKNILNIQNENNQTIDKITVTDIMGKIVFNQNKGDSINVQTLQQGMYIIQISSEGNLYSDKFIKE